MGKEYYGFKCELFGENIITQRIQIKLKSLVLTNEENEKILINNRNVNYDFYSNGYSILFNLYIENYGVEDRIDYLLDEDYEITELNLDIYDVETKLYYGHNIISEYGQLKINFKEKLLAGIINCEFSDEAVALIGHRPDRLYGYNLNNPKYQELATLIADNCEKLILEKNITYFITGGTLGGETISFFAIEFLKKKYPNIKNILAIPFKKVYVKWQPTDIERHNRMISLADGVIEVDLLNDYKVPNTKIGEYDVNKLMNKSDFIVDSVETLVAIFDGKFRGNTYHTISHAKYYNKKVNIIDISNKEEDIEEIMPF